MSRSTPNRYFRFENADEPPFLVLGRCKKGVKAIARRQGRRVDSDTKITEFIAGSDERRLIINPRGAKS